jgi:hypothetical protein
VGRRVLEGGRGGGAAARCVAGNNGAARRLTRCAEVIIFGTGATVCPPPQRIKSYLHSLGIQLTVESTVRPAFSLCWPTADAQTPRSATHARRTTCSSRRAAPSPRRFCRQSEGPRRRCPTTRAASTWRTANSWREGRERNVMVLLRSIGAGHGWSEVRASHAQDAPPRHETRSLDDPRRRRQCELGR